MFFLTKKTPWKMISDFIPIIFGFSPGTTNFG